MRRGCLALRGALSSHEDCRRLLLDAGIIPTFLTVKFRGWHTPEEDSSADQDTNTKESSTLCVQVDCDPQLAMAPEAPWRNHGSDGRLCCALTLANMSLDPAARVAMVRAKAVKALSILSETSYAEENQLACARAPSLQPLFYGLQWPRQKPRR